MNAEEYCERRIAKFEESNLKSHHEFRTAIAELQDKVKKMERDIDELKDFKRDVQEALGKWRAPR